MIRNFNHAMSSGISIGTGAGSDGGREGRMAGQAVVDCAGPGELRTIRTFNFFN